MEQTPILLPWKFSPEDASEFKRSFGMKASLPVTLCAPANPHDNTRFCCFNFTLLECHIHDDEDRAFAGFFKIYSWLERKLNISLWGGEVDNETSVSYHNRKCPPIPDIVLTDLHIFLAKAEENQSLFSEKKYHKIRQR